MPDWPGLSDVTQDGQLANPLPGGCMVWPPDDFAAWPSGTDGSVAPGDLIQSQFGPAATITVTIATEAELASLALPTLPARPHARRTHFSRHDYQPFFANAPRNLSRLSGVTARTYVPRNDFSTRHQCPLGDVAVALSACHIAQQSSSLSCLPGPKRKNPQKRMTLCGFLIRVHFSR
ncbi:hypothetical protein [Thalassospira xiamenensis]|uniref:hypothetical protein n=1 Tax=Thalassospira xiamenensis TaxID=220697 RepID=UPI00115DB205|nr:hypothetical protein [Thalassospira xiamenensis]